MHCTGDAIHECLHMNQTTHMICRAVHESKLLFWHSNKFLYIIIHLLTNQANIWINVPSLHIKKKGGERKYHQSSPIHACKAIPIPHNDFFKKNAMCLSNRRLKREALVASVSRSHIAVFFLKKSKMIHSHTSSLEWHSYLFPWMWTCRKSAHVHGGEVHTE